MHSELCAMTALSKMPIYGHTDKALVLWMCPTNYNTCGSACKLISGLSQEVAQKSLQLCYMRPVRLFHPAQFDSQDRSHICKSQRSIV